MPHVDIPIFPPLPPCDYLAAVREAVSNQYRYTSDICMHSLTLPNSRRDCLRTWTTEAITACDMFQQWEPSSCLVPSHSSRSLWAQELPYVVAAIIVSVYSVSTTAQYVFVGFALGAAPSPDGLVLFDPVSICLGYEALALWSTACGISSSCVVRLNIIC